MKKLVLAVLLLLAAAFPAHAVVDASCNFTAGSTTTNQGFINCAEELAELYKRGLVRSVTIGGTTNAITGTSVNNAATVLSDGLTVVVIPSATITGAATFQLDGTAAKSIRKADGTAAGNGDATSGTLYLFSYRSADNGGAGGWRIISQFDSLTPRFVANGTGGTWGSRRHTLGSSTALAPLSFYSSIDYPAQLRYIIGVQRHDLEDSLGASTLDRAVQIDMTRALANDTRVWGIGIIGDDSSDGGQPYVGLYSQMTRQIGGTGNNFAGVFELDDYDGQTDSVAVEINAGIPDGTTYTNASLLHLIVGTHDTEAGVGTLPQAIQINTSGVAGNRKAANLTKAIDIREDGTGRITNGIYINTSPGAGTGTAYFDAGTKGTGLNLSGTYDVAAITTSGFLLKPSDLTLGVNNTAWVAHHTDTDRTIEINGGNAVNTGGNIRLNGQAHATRPDAVELRAGNVSQLTVNATDITSAAKLNLPVVTTSAAPLNVGDGSTGPSAPVNGDVWTNGGLFRYRSGGVTYSIPSLGIASTWTAKQTMPASTTSAASINIPHGTAPSAPVDGDIWTSISGGISHRTNGATYTVANVNGSQTFTGKKTFSAATTGGAFINIAHGVAPSAPVDGDVWTTTTGLFAQINGSTIPLQKPVEAFCKDASDETTVITTGTAKVTFRMPYAFTLTSIRASLNTASSSGNPAFDVNEGGVSVFSTTLTIDASEKTSTTAATPAVISDTSLADDAEITIDIDTAGTGAKGAKICLIGRAT